MMNGPKKIRFALLCACLMSGCAANRPLTREPSLKVTRAVLYQNGIGFFERRGKLDGQSLRFEVRNDQIGDVLKTLTVVDLAEGRPVSIGFPVEKSRSRRLAELPPQVRAGGGIAALVEALRGARAEIRSTKGTKRGRIIGLDKQGKSGSRLSVLQENGAIDQIPVDSIETLKLLDATIASGLEKSLDVSLNDASWRPIPLEIRLDHAKKHDLVVSYVVEMPVWKPAYRLVFAEPGKVLLQGWAIVDNVSGEDWRDVNLSLVAGTPLAFTYDLYSPRYKRRADLTPPEDEEAMAPPEAEVGPAMEESVASAPPPPPESAPVAEKREKSRSRARNGSSKAKKAGRSKEVGAGSGYGGLASKPGSFDDLKSADLAQVTPADLERNARALVEGVTAGALFRYDISAPVTVLDRESALVNLVSARVHGEDALLFRVGVDKMHPFRVARFKNQTKLVLERGPIAIYRDSAFLGETVAPRMDPNAVVYVPYAQEARVRVDLSTHQSEEAARLVRIVNGSITAESKLVTKHVYDVKNKTDEKLTLYVDREKRTNWRVSEVIIEQGKNKARGSLFEEGGRNFVPVTLEAGASVRISVFEETPTRRTFEALEGTARKTVSIYVNRPDADPKVARQLREALALSDDVAELERRIEGIKEQKASLGERQTQVRENIKALQKVPGNGDLKAKLHKSLSELESKLGDLTRKEIEASEERVQKRERLAALLREIRFEDHF